VNAPPPRVELLLWYIGALGDEDEKAYVRLFV
jgi:hypothetical protein